MSWITSQLGSREHYAIPRALHEVGHLNALFTDVWIGKGMAGLLKPLVPSLASRRHCGIPDALVRSSTVGRVLMDRRLRQQKLPSWEACLQRNQWYSGWASTQLQRVQADVFFSYAYTARQPFQTAKRRGMRCILDQIDGAWREEQVWRELSRPYHDIEAEVDQAPPLYWEKWNEELELADVIVVNSGWSKKLIIEAGTDERKIVEIPLFYEPVKPAVGSRQSSAEDHLVTRHSPPLTAYGDSLRALFLGSVVLRKGVGQLFDTIRLLKTEPVDFTFAGPINVRVPDDIRAMPHVRFLGPVDRATADRLYAESDVFLFPTLSDGFGLTQLEALGHGLPVIASLNCGQVVENRVSGLILPEVSPMAIAEAIMELVRDRDQLAQLKSGAHVPDKFHPKHLGPALLALEHTPDR
jgi:glycosyltransferase involved in cell wall biosynthesis